MDAFSFSFNAAATTVEAAAVAAAAVLATVAPEKRIIIKKTTTTKCFEGMISSSFNIQHQSTGIGALSSLDEIALRRSTRGFFPSPMARKKIK